MIAGSNLSRTFRRGLLATDYAFDDQMCRTCGGLCCQGHPGVWADPVRFEGLFHPGRHLSPDQLAEKLPDWGLELRDFSGVPVPGPRSGEDGCFFLGPDGCRLPPEQRPGQCLALIPDLETLITGEIHCRLPGPFTFGEIRRRWQEYWQRQD